LLSWMQMLALESVGPESGQDRLRLCLLWRLVLADVGLLRSEPGLFGVLGPGPSFLSDGAVVMAKVT